MDKIWALLRKVIWLAPTIFLTISQLVDPGARLVSSIYLVGSESRAFYCLQNLGALAEGLAISGVAAHTSLDNDVRDWYQYSVRNETTNLCSSIVKPLGNGKLSLPVYCLTAAAGMLIGGGTYAVLANWGSVTLRALLVGAPPMLFLQAGLGSSRPGDNNSAWHPFKDNHGVSGHCFLGAVPFLSAAMFTANPYLKAALYLASTLTGISRINDDAHFLSQVLIGWWLAWLAVSCIRIKRNRKTIPIPEERP